MNAIPLPSHPWWTRSPADCSAGLPALADAWLRRVLAAAGRTPSRVAAEPLAAGPAEAATPEADLRDVDAAVGGDGDAYARLVRRYQDRVAATLWRFTRDPLQWEELVQDVFVEAYVSLPSYKGRAPLEHWLRRIATRVGYRFWRQRDKRRSDAPLSIQDWDQVFDGRPDQADAREAAETVHAILQCMAPRDRLVLTLIYLEGCSVAEAAHLAGWTRTMTKVQAHRARKRLERMLVEKGRTDERDR